MARDNGLLPIDDKSGQIMVHEGGGYTQEKLLAPNPV